MEKERFREAIKTEAIKKYLDQVIYNAINCEKIPIEEIEERRQIYEALSNEQKEEFEERRRTIVEMLFDYWKDSPQVVEPNENCYYHVADLFCVPLILKEGLKNGKDGNIWVYSDLITTEGICEMCAKKKIIQNNSDEKFYRWRNLFNCGFGIIQIDKSQLPNDLDFFDDISRTDLKALCISDISKNALTFLGAWDYKAKKIISVDLSRYEDWIKNYLYFINTNNIFTKLPKQEFIAKYRYEIEFARNALKRIQ